MTAEAEKGAEPLHVRALAKAAERQSKALVVLAAIEALRDEYGGMNKIQHAAYQHHYYDLCAILGDADDR